jgi:hypothetical protein
VHHANYILSADLSDVKRVLRTKTVFSIPTDGSTRSASEAGNESAKRIFSGLEIPKRQFPLKTQVASMKMQAIRESS